MDADEDSTWICTQAVVNTDSQSDDEQEKINNVSTSYIYLLYLMTGGEGLAYIILKEEILRR